MSLSREIALADEETLEQIFTALAEEVFTKKIQHRNGINAAFRSWVRPHFSALHRGGMSKERLQYLEKFSRQVFYKVKARMVPAAASADNQESDSLSHSAGRTNLPERLFFKPNQAAARSFVESKNG
jgi:hypothetical protein